MNTILTLMKREWLQHRFGWTLLALVPLLIAVLGVSFGQVQLDDDSPQRLGDEGLAVMATLFSFGAAAGLTLVLLTVTSFFLLAGLARRDHGDRSNEFWLSLPVSHRASFGAPLLVHALLVPMAAVLVGLAGGWLISLIVVSRLTGFESWLGLPWGSVLMGVGAAAGRVLAGIPLAVAWLAPLIGLLVLANALFRGWGLPALVAIFAAGSLLLDRLAGNSVLPAWLDLVFETSGKSLVGAASGRDVTIGSAADVAAFVADMPRLAGLDLAAAFRLLGQPVFAVGLAVAGACFFALLQWRARSA